MTTESSFLQSWLPSRRNLIAGGSLIALGLAIAGAGMLAGGIEVPRAEAEEASEGRVSTFDDIKFDMKKGDPFVRSMLPGKIEQLKGTKIRIRGYMLPSFKQKGITQFVLVRDNMECCFGPGAALYDCILIHMSPGTSANFSTRPITVEGVFSIEEFKDPDGKHLAIYRMDATSAQ